MAILPYAPTPLVRELDSGDEARVVAALKSIKHLNISRLRRFDAVKSVLETTNSAHTRNAAAIALADLGFKTGAEVIIKQLRRPETEGARGSLLYALAEMDATVPISLLLNIIFKDSFEAQAEALGILEHKANSYSIEDLVRAKKKATLEKRRGKNEIAVEVLGIINAAAAKKSSPQVR